MTPLPTISAMVGDMKIIIGTHIELSIMTNMTTIFFQYFATVF